MCPTPPAEILADETRNSLTQGSITTITQSRFQRKYPVTVLEIAAVDYNLRLDTLRNYLASKTASDIGS